MSAERWLVNALERDEFDVTQFKAVTQLHAVLSKHIKSEAIQSFSPEECREGVKTLFGKEIE